MTICYFGIYDRDYCRTKNLINGLKQNNADIIEIQASRPGFLKYLKLFWRHHLVRNKYDVMIVGFCGHVVMPLAWLITRRPIILDAHISLYDAEIFQKKRHKPKSLGAGFYFFIDWLACKLADKVLLDTREHVKFFVDTFKINPKKFLVVYNGTDNQLFAMRSPKDMGDKFIVEFHAYVTLLHGLDYILLAMKKLMVAGENVELWCVGASDEYEKMKLLAGDLGLNNVKFFPPMPPDALYRDIICRADVGLGIFGQTNKVDLVIPNKLYELMASGVPVISADSPAVREQFESGRDLYLCPKADPDAIFNAIIELKNNDALRNDMVISARVKIDAGLNPNIMVANLLADLTAQGILRRHKLVAILRIKDEIEIIRESLTSLSKLVDEIIIVDNGSTDGSEQVYGEFPRVIKVIHTVGFDEGRDKIMLLQEAKLRQPNWILFLDADEIFEANLTRRDLERYMDSKYDRINFRLCHFWKNRLRCRLDKKYFLYSLQPLRSMWRDTLTTYFADKKIHNGDIMGTGRRVYFSPWRIKHYGLINEQKITEKLNLYRSIDGDVRNYDHLDPVGHFFTYQFKEFKNREINYIFILMLKYFGHILWVGGVLSNKLSAKK